MEKVKLTEICQPKQWKTIPTSDLLEEGFPVYGANGIIGYYKEYNHNNPVIAITCRGATCGSINITVPQAYVTGNAMCLDDLRQDIDITYLYYCLLHYNFATVISGSAQPQITRQGLEKVVVSIRTLEEQKIIVSVLGRVRTLIEKRKAQLAALDELVKARFVEMFGDVIQNNMGWSKHVFSEIASSRLGKMLDAKQQKGNCKFPYLANFNVQWFRFELKNLNEMDFDKEDQVEFELKDGDLLVCEGGEIGRCAVWHNELQPCYFQKALHRVRCNTNIILPDYMARWFQYNCEHGGFSSIEGAKATISHLPGAKLKTLQVVTPPIDIQKIFVDFVAQVDKTKEVVKKSLDKAQLLFDSLMQQYFG